MTNEEITKFMAELRERQRQMKAKRNEEERCR